MHIDEVTEVVATDEFDAWYQGLAEEDALAVTRAVDRLAQLGVRLGFPHSSAIKGSKHALRELRVQSGGRPIRILYAFDPRRQAVLLIGGDKSGDNRFYELMVPFAEQIFDAFLREQAEGKHDGKEE